MQSFYKNSDTSIDSRNSAVEMLRIFSMLLIVMSHLSCHGIREHVNVLVNNSLIQHFNNFFLIMFSFSGKIGVNIFVLITGYFCINKFFKFDNFFKIFSLTVFYSWLFLILSYIIGLPTTNTLIILQHIFPIGGGAYWFVTTYLVLYVFINYINRFLNNLSQNDYKLFLLLAFVLLSLIPSLSIYGKYGFSELFWFLFVYSIGGYIKTYNLKLETRIIFLSMFILIIMQSLIVGLIVYSNEINIPNFIFKMNGLYQMFMALFIFNIIINIKIKSNKWINYIASSTFSVYLIHDNIFVRAFLWHRIIPIEHIYYSYYYILYSLLTVILVFTVCIFIDKILSFIYKPVTKYLLNIIHLKEETIKNLVNNILKIKNKAM